MIRDLFSVQAEVATIEMDRQENKLSRSYECQQCGSKFSKLRLLAEHSRIFRHFDSFEYSVCKTRFSRKANLDKYLLRHQYSTQHECQSCRKVFSRADLHEQHAKEKHNQSGGESGKRLLDDIDDEQEI